MSNMKAQQGGAAMSDAREKVLAEYPDAQTVWTSRGWRVFASIPHIGTEEIGRTNSAHVPEIEAWEDAARRLGRKLDGC
jgi:hypothetical protein